MNTLSTQSRFVENRNRTTKRCEHDGCGQVTREGKPFCPDHVEDHDYVTNLLSQIADKEDEEERARNEGVGAVDVEGQTAYEILLTLQLHGQRTLARLTRELQLDEAVLETYVKALLEKKWVVVGRTQRGSKTVKLAKGKTVVEI